MDNKLLPTKVLILKTAYDLFSMHGYEKVSVNAIIEKARISKGGFYHHFKSKEEVIEVIAQQQVDTVLAIIESIANQSNLSAIQKFNQLIDRVQTFRSMNKSEMYKLYEGYLKGNNQLLRDKLEAYTLKKALPPYVKIVKQGISEGVFHTTNPELVVETIIRIAPIMRMKMATLYLRRDKISDYVEQIHAIADYLEEFVTKILGAEQGVLKISSHFKSYFSKD